MQVWYDVGCVGAGLAGVAGVRRWPGQRAMSVHGTAPRRPLLSIRREPGPARPARAAHRDYSDWGFEIEEIFD